MLVWNNNSTLHNTLKEQDLTYIMAEAYHAYLHDVREYKD
jgi:hypothetical protein